MIPKKKHLTLMQLTKNQNKYSEFYCVCKVRMIRQFYTVNKMTVKVSQYVNFHSKYIENIISRQVGRVPLLLCLSSDFEAFYWAVQSSSQNLLSALKCNNVIKY